MVATRIVKLLLTWVLTVSYTCYACPPVLYIKEGTPAPCTGYLFSPEKELELRIFKSDYEFLQKELEIQRSLTELHRLNVVTMGQMLDKSREIEELWRKAAIENTKQLVSMQESRDRRDWLYFAGGILATVAAGYAIGQAAK